MCYTQTIAFFLTSLPTKWLESRVSSRMWSPKCPLIPSDFLYKIKQKASVIFSFHFVSFSLFSSVQFSRSLMSDSLWPHGLQHARPPCPSLTPGVYPNSCPPSQWCHPAISSSVFPFSSCPQSLSASGSFPMSQLFAWVGQSIGVTSRSINNKAGSWVSVWSSICLVGLWHAGTSGPTEGLVWPCCLPGLVETSVYLPAFVRPGEQGCAAGPGGVQGRLVEGEDLTPGLEDEVPHVCSCTAHSFSLGISWICTLFSTIVAAATAVSSSGARMLHLLDHQGKGQSTASWCDSWKVSSAQLDWRQCWSSDQKSVQFNQQTLLEVHDLGFLQLNLSFYQPPPHSHLHHSLRDEKRHISLGAVQWYGLFF